MDYATADEATKTSLKVIADHTRAVTYLISDGVVPSNLGRGYIVRRLLRRVVLKGRLLGVKKPFVAEVAQVAIDMSGDCDPEVRAHLTRARGKPFQTCCPRAGCAELKRSHNTRGHVRACRHSSFTRCARTQVKKNASKVLRQITAEEERFLGTIGGGENVLNRMMAKAKSGGAVLSGADAFLMYDTHGFPLELTREVAEAEGLTVDDAGFEAAMQQQKKRSKARLRPLPLHVPKPA